MGPRRGKVRHANRRACREGQAQGRSALLPGQVDLVGQQANQEAIPEVCEAGRGGDGEVDQG